MAAARVLATTTGKTIGAPGTSALARGKEPSLLSAEDFTGATVVPASLASSDEDKASLSGVSDVAVPSSSSYP